MFDWSKTLLRTLLFFLICLFFGTVLSMFIIGSAMFDMIMVPILFALFAIIAFILTFIPFFENKLWLIPLIEVVVAVIIALIAYFF